MRMQRNGYYNTKVHRSGQTIYNNVCCSNRGGMVWQIVVVQTNRRRRVPFSIGTFVLVYSVCHGATSGRGKGGPTRQCCYPPIENPMPAIGQFGLLRLMWFNTSVRSSMLVAEYVRAVCTQKNSTV